MEHGPINIVMKGFIAILPCDTLLYALRITQKTAAKTKKQLATLSNDQFHIVQCVQRAQTPLQFLLFISFHFGSISRLFLALLANTHTDRQARVSLDLGMSQMDQLLLVTFHSLPIFTNAALACHFSKQHIRILVHAEAFKTDGSRLCIECMYENKRKMNEETRSKKTEENH